MEKDKLIKIARQWLNFANSDLILTKQLKEGILLNPLCFHAQQAVEKSLKALLIYNNISFPKTHDIQKLLQLLPNDIDVPEYVKESGILTGYAVDTRYPGDVDDITEEEYSHAVDIAENTVNWTKKMLED